MTPPVHLVHGIRVSFFTRKVTGYLDHKGIAWELAPSVGMNQPAMEAGWNGGIPVVTTPEGAMIWDSTSIICHLDTRHRDPAVQPEDRALRFIDFLLDDFNDEWLYRHAVGSRWLIVENAGSGSADIAREAIYEIPAPFNDVRSLITESMTACLPRLGVTPENLGGWIDESLVPWLRAFGTHVGEHGYLLGARPSLSDFAVFGGNVAHFTNDPWCLRLIEATSPAILEHTRRLQSPSQQQHGQWFEADDLPESLIAVLAETGRHYLPWVAEATVTGSATVTFEGGATAQIPATEFLKQARGILLARYVEARSPLLDSILEAAGILVYFADHADQATAIPDPLVPPRPSDNRPYPAGS